MKYNAIHRRSQSFPSAFVSCEKVYTTVVLSLINMHLFKS
jgi:hypothetical protein